jgi:hypothetical protein
LNVLQLTAEKRCPPPLLTFTFSHLRATRTSLLSHHAIKALGATITEDPVIFAVVAALTFIRSLHQPCQLSRLSRPQETQGPTKIIQPYHYTPSPLEQYFLDNAQSLGLRSNNSTPTCPLINDEKSQIYQPLQRYFQQLDVYNEITKGFTPIQNDLRANILHDESNIEQVCSAVRIHPGGLEGIFNSSGTSSSTHAGAMEPLLPVMRNHKICQQINMVSLSTICILKLTPPKSKNFPILHFVRSRVHSTSCPWNTSSMISTPCAKN